MLGKRLFVRTTRSCWLTTDGRTLLLYAEGVLNAVDRLQDTFCSNLLGAQSGSGCLTHIFIPALGGRLQRIHGKAACSEY